AYLQSKQIDEARTAFAAAVHLQEGVLETAKDPQQCRVDLALAYGNLALLQMKTDETAGADASIARAAELQKQLLEVVQDDPKRLRQLAVNFAELGELHDRKSQLVK